MLITWISLISNLDHIIDCTVLIRGRLDIFELLAIVTVLIHILILSQVIFRKNILLQFFLVLLRSQIHVFLNTFHDKLWTAIRIIALWCILYLIHRWQFLGRLFLIWFKAICVENSLLVLRVDYWWYRGNIPKFRLRIVYSWFDFKHWLNL